MHVMVGLMGMVDRQPLQAIKKVSFLALFLHRQIRHI